METNEKSKVGLIVGIVAAVLAVCGIGVAVVCLFLSKETPESKIAKGLANLGKEAAELQNPVLADVTGADLGKMIGQGRTSTEVSMNLSGDFLEDNTLGLDMKLDYDYPNKVLDSNFKVSMANIPIVTLLLAAQEDDIYVGMEQLFDGYLAFSGTNLQEQYDNSVLSGLFGDLNLGETELNLFPEIKELDTDKEIDWNKELTQDIAAELLALKEAIVIDESEATYGAYRDGTEVTCKGYSVVIPAEEMNSLIAKETDVIMSAWKEQLEAGQVRRIVEESADREQDSWDEEWEELKENATLQLEKDLSLLIFMDKKNNIVRIETADDIAFTDSLTSFNVQLDLTGAKWVSSNMELTVKGSGDADGTVILAVNRYPDKDVYTQEVIVSVFDEEEEIGNASYHALWGIEDKTFDMKVVCAKEEESLEIHAKGTIGNMVKGKEYQLDIEELEFMQNEESVVKGSYNISMKALEETPVMPEDTLRIFEATEEQIYDLYQEISNNMDTYSQVLSMLQ